MPSISDFRNGLPLLFKNPIEIQKEGSIPIIFLVCFLNVHFSIELITALIYLIIEIHYLFENSEK